MARSYGRVRTVLFAFCGEDPDEAKEDSPAHGPASLEALRVYAGSRWHLATFRGPSHTDHLQSALIGAWNTCERQV
jgi:hypothetical protein